MTILKQLTRLHSLRQFKVDRLFMLAQVANARVTALNAEYAAVQEEYRQTCVRNRQGFDQLFKAAADIRDPQSRIVAINRTMQNQQAEVARARARIEDIDADLKSALHARDTANNSLVQAQKQLDCVEVFRDTEALFQTRRDDDIADEAAQEQFGATAFALRHLP